MDTKQRARARTSLAYGASILLNGGLWLAYGHALRLTSSQPETPHEHLLHVTKIDLYHPVQPHPQLISLQPSPAAGSRTASDDLNAASAGQTASAGKGDTSTSTSNSNEAQSRDSSQNAGQHEQSLSLMRTGNSASKQNDRDGQLASLGNTNDAANSAARGLASHGAAHPINASALVAKLGSYQEHGIKPGTVSSGAGSSPDAAQSPNEAGASAASPHLVSASIEHKQSRSSELSSLKGSGQGTKSKPMALRTASSSLVTQSGISALETKDETTNGPDSKAAETQKELDKEPDSKEEKTLTLHVIKMWAPEPGQKLHLATNLKIVIPPDVQVLPGRPLTEEQVEEVRRLLAQQTLHHVDMDKNVLRKLLSALRLAQSEPQPPTPPAPPKPAADNGRNRRRDQEAKAQGQKNKQTVPPKVQVAQRTLPKPVSPYLFRPWNTDMYRRWAPSYNPNATKVSGTTASDKGQHLADPNMEASNIGTPGQIKPPAVTSGADAGGQDSAPGQQGTPNQNNMAGQQGAGNQNSMAGQQGKAGQNSMGAQQGNGGGQQEGNGKAGQQGGNQNGMAGQQGASSNQNGMAGQQGGSQHGAAGQQGAGGNQNGMAADQQAAGGQNAVTGPAGGGGGNQQQEQQAAGNQSGTGTPGAADQNGGSQDGSEQGGATGGAAGGMLAAELGDTMDGIDGMKPGITPLDARQDNGLTDKDAPSIPDLPMAPNGGKKGIPGALVLPPAPPEGTDLGQNPIFHAIRHVFLQLASGVLGTGAQDSPEQTKVPVPGNPDRMSRKPVPAPLSVGSTSTRGDVAISNIRQTTPGLKSFTSAPPRPRIPGTTHSSAGKPQQHNARMASSYDKKEKSAIITVEVLQTANNSHGMKVGTDAPLPPTPMPDSDMQVGDGSGLKGDYYIGRRFNQFVFTRSDANINFQFDQLPGRSPSPRIAPGAEYTVRWTGKIAAKYSETYTMFATVDDGVRVWIDHKLVIDDWSDHPATQFSNTFTFVAGHQYDFKVEYMEIDGGQASVRLYWESPSQKREFIPEDSLFYPLPSDEEDMKNDKAPL